MSTHEKEVLEMLDAARLVPPWTPDNLWYYIASFYGLKIPRVAVCPGHSAPFDFVVGSYFDTTDRWSKKHKALYSPHGDCVVWACRSGGKTMLGAVSARLKALFRPRCGIRILGGSSDQAKKMYEHISKFDRISFSDMIQGDACQERTRYTNGSHVEILMASQTSVRGPHVPVLMFDEVDEFRDEIYRAAIPIAQSKDGVRATIEEFSTAHRPNGIMHRLVREASESGKMLYKWCVFEVLQQCRLRCGPEEPYRKCHEMVKYDQLNQPHRFSDVCAGRAKKSRGYYRIEDLWQKFSHPMMTWEGFSTEYLCELPMLEDATFPMASAIHIIPDWPKEQWAGIYNLILGADAGPTNSWVVWVAVGRAYPQDDFKTAVVVKEIHTTRHTPASDFADLIVSEHVKAGFPKAITLFNGPASVPQDTYLALEMDKPHRRELIFSNDRERVGGGCCTRVDSEGKEYGQETIATMLALRPDPEGEPRPALMFCKSARAIYDTVATQQRKGEEHHGVAALRYALRGWERKESWIMQPRPKFVCVSSAD